jgi:hypothetical protein
MENISLNRTTGSYEGLKAYTKKGGEIQFISTRQMMMGEQFLHGVPGWKQQGSQAGTRLRSFIIGT